MARLLFVGNITVNQGPFIVNRRLVEKLPKNTLYATKNNQIINLFHVMFKLFFADVILYSNLSKINLFCIFWAKILRKKTIYLVHGGELYLLDGNESKSEKADKRATKMLEGSCKILCVSEKFAKIARETYPQYAKKIGFLNNGVEWELFDKPAQKNVSRDENTIMTIGGGVPRKRIYFICLAIEAINKEREIPLKLIVLGNEGTDTEKIKNFDFVNYFDRIPKKEVENYYRSSKLYIQNSQFEPFGLAPIEALMCGCSLLISRHTGILSIMKTERDCDIINDVDDPSEIKEKILFILENDNNEYLMDLIDRETSSYDYAAKKLMEIVENLNSEK